MSDRASTLNQLADRIRHIEGRAVVAIDGVDGAGKTSFANKLANILEGHGREVVQASIDSFHNCRAIRYRRGKHDPDGFFLDSYDYDSFRHHLIDPFRTGATTIETARFDHKTDEIVTSSRCKAGADAILLIDGIFLHREELYKLWDFSIFLDVPFTVSYRRMAARDGSDPDALAASNHRYYQGQRLYLAQCNPGARATIIVDNSTDHYW